jgi:hypothetical protein
MFIYNCITYQLTSNALHSHHHVCLMIAHSCWLMRSAAGVMPSDRMGTDSVLHVQLCLERVTGHNIELLDCLATQAA